MVHIEAVHMIGGSEHEHIDAVRWRNPDTGDVGTSGRAEMVRWIQSGGEAFVLDATGHRARVGVVKVIPPYLRTHADGAWTDNLLGLPRL